MSELKTTANNKSVITFLNTIQDQQKREDSFVLLSLFEKVTQQQGVMWGDSIIGFGKYRYTNTKGEHEWMLKVSRRENKVKPCISCKDLMFSRTYYLA